MPHTKLVTSILLFATLVFSKSNFKPLNSSELELQFQRSIVFLLKNTSPQDGARGSVIAAPSRSHPDYYFHWVRDAALVVESLMDVYTDPRFRNSALKKQIRAFFLDHLQFNSKIQVSSQSFKGLGEPKFLVTGFPFTGPWGRPQNDGPALRASFHARLLTVAIQEKWPELNTLVPLIYAPKIPADTLMKRDLEYVAHHWKEPNFDLWEEVLGLHFYTLLSQKKSMLMGAAVANAYKDGGAAQFYTTQATQISQTLENFWSQNKGYIEATKSVSRGRNKSQLDSAVILGVLHSEIENAAYSVSDARVIATFLRMKATFDSIYTINRNKQLGTAIGRYPEDTYDGYNTNSRGNPWVLSTAGAGEYLYRLILHHAKTKRIGIHQANRNYFAELSGDTSLKIGQVLTPVDRTFSLIIKGLFQEADSYLARVLFHKNADGSLSEQINRESGFLQGAPNLTWSHASVITAKLRRDQVISAARNILSN